MRNEEYLLTIGGWSDIGTSIRGGKLLDGAGGERKDGEVLAVADLDHVAVGVVEEELVHDHSSLLHHRRHVLDPYPIQLLHDQPHV